MNFNNRMTKVFGMVMVAMLMVGSLFAFMPQTAAAASPQYDVYVHEAGPAGSIAAIAASDMNATVFMSTKYSAVGGQMSRVGGVSNMDEGYVPSFDAKVERQSGLVKEFEDRLVGTLGAPINSATSYFRSDSIAARPGTVEQVLNAMFQARRDQGRTLVVATTTELTAISVTPNMVTATLRNSQTGAVQTITAKRWIEADEFGDGLALAGIPYILGSGQSPNLNLDEPLGMVTSAVEMKVYPAGIPSYLRIAQAPPGYAQYAPEFAAAFASPNAPWVQQYTLSPVERNLLPYRGFPDPRAIGANAGSPQAAAGILRFSLNYGNDVQVTTRYWSDASYRREVDCTQVRPKAIALIYWLQQLGWNVSVADDSGYETMPYNVANKCSQIPAWLDPIQLRMPEESYVRANRAVIGVQPVTSEGEATQKAWYGNRYDPSIESVSYPTSVLVAGYNTDIHGQSVDYPPTDRPGDANGTHGPFQVPFGALVPASVDGTVVASAPYAGPIAYSALRLQPAQELLGQAAGTLAALSALNNLQPRQVPPAMVQYAEAYAGVQLSLQAWTDVTRQTAGWSAIQVASVERLMMGSGGTYSPNGLINRGEGLIVVDRLFGLPFDGSIPSAFAIAKEAGLTTAGSLDQFRPNDKLIKGDLALLLARGMHQQPVDAVQSVDWLRANGVDVSCYSSSCVTEEVARWQMATAAVQSLIRLGLGVISQPQPQSSPPVDTSAAPCTVTNFQVPDLRAWNEHPDGPILSGWVIDVNNMGAVTADGSNPCPARLDIYVDGKFYIAIYANLPDHGGADHTNLAAAFGEGHTSIRYEYALPKEVQGHRIEVLAVARDLANEGKTPDYACRTPNSYWDGKGPSPWYPNWCGVTAPKSVPGQPGRGTASGSPPQPKPGPQTTPKLGSQHGEPWGYVDNIVIRDGVYILRAWAIDPDDCHAAVRIQVFRGKDWHGVYVGEGKADLPAEAVIGKQCDGVSAHRVEIPLPPELVKAGGTLSLWAINIGPNGWNSQLQDSPASIEQLLALGAGQ